MWPKACGDKRVALSRALTTRVMSACCLVLANISTIGRTCVCVCVCVCVCECVCVSVCVSVCVK